MLALHGPLVVLLASLRLDDGRDHEAVSRPLALRGAFVFDVAQPYALRKNYYHC